MAGLSARRVLAHSHIALSPNPGQIWGRFHGNIGARWPRDPSGTRHPTRSTKPLQTSVVAPRDRAVPPQTPAEQRPDAGSFLPNNPDGNRNKNKNKSPGITAWRPPPETGDFHLRARHFNGQILQK